MRKTIVLFFLLGVFLSSNVMAAPYYRFWRGWKLDAISSEQFESSLNDIFVPATIEVGSGRGLLAYLPVLTSRRPDGVASIIPDEIALVIYKSEDIYRELRATPEGQAYGTLHWDYFDRAKGSTSLVPLPFTDKLELGQAYDVLQSDADWQKGTAVYYISRKKQDPTDYVNAMKNEFSKKSLISYLVLVTEQYVIEYQLWENGIAFENTAMDVLKAQSHSLEVLESSSGVARAAAPYNANLRYGGALNVQFSFEQKVIQDPLAYSRENTQNYAEDNSDMEPFGLEDCTNTSDDANNPKITCGGKTTVLVHGGHPHTHLFTCDYEFSKTPTEKFFVVRNECN